MRATAWLLAAGLVAIGIPAGARTIIVGPHDSIQGAVDQAALGTRSRFGPGRTMRRVAPARPSLATPAPSSSRRTTSP